MRSATREFQLDEIEPIDQSKIARAILSRVVNVEFLWAARARNPAMRAIELKRMRSEKILISGFTWRTPIYPRKIKGAQMRIKG